MKQPLTKSPRYVEFIRERDSALEEILHKYLNAIDRVTKGLHKRVEEIVSHYFATGQSLDGRLDNEFQHAALVVRSFVMDLRRDAYLLAHAGELEGISRATGKKSAAKITKEEMAKVVMGDHALGGTVLNRIMLAMSRLKRDVIDAVQLTQTLEEDVRAALDRVARAFPSKKRFKRGPRVLSRPIKESDADPKTGRMWAGIVDEDEWQEMVDNYLSDFLPPRGYFDRAVEKTSSGEEIVRDSWELERDVTHDFVSLVRGGQVDAANKEGITDFVWVSVVDDKTDECCLWRDGLTLTEIRAELEEGKHDDDDCEGDTPPLHTHCRCNLAPYTDDMPEVPPSNIGDFEEWLNNVNQY